MVQNSMVQKKTDKTREALLLAGEELMGWRGIEAVSVRDINARAGQKNTSAIRYHFDNKEGLLEAILDDRMVHLDRLRADALAGLLTQGTASTKKTTPPVAELVRVLILPLAHMVIVHEPWQNYILLLAQIVSAQGASYQPLWHGKHDGTAVAIIQLCRTQQPDLDPVHWEQRVRDMMTFTIGSLCERVYTARQAGRDRRLTDEQYLAHLLGMATLMLTAPPLGL